MRRDATRVARRALSTGVTFTQSCPPRPAVFVAQYAPTSVSNHDNPPTRETRPDGARRLTLNDPAEYTGRAWIASTSRS